MGKETVEALVEGGKATAAPPLGPSLGSLKVNIGQAIDEINEKTRVFKDMKVPVKVIVDKETKDFKIEVGTPPSSQLIKKEIGIEKGSGEPNKNKAGAITFESIIKITKMKQDSLLINNLKAGVKSIVGSCVSLGVLIDGKDPKDVMKEINRGEYDNLIKAECIDANEDKKGIMEDLTKELDAKLKELRKQKEAEKAAGATAATTGSPGEEKKEEKKIEEKKK